MAEMFRTATGDVESSSLGYVQCHEHIFWDTRRYIPESILNSDDPRVTDPVEKVNYYWLRRNYYNIDNNVFNDFDIARDELIAFRRAGGEVLVDSTSIGVGRDAAKVARLSLATGVAVIVGTGFYVERFQDASTLQSSASELARRIETELLDGIDGTDVRAGFIGEVGLSWPVTDFEARSLQAAAQVQQEHGCVVQVHPGRDPKAPLDAVERFLGFGGTPERLIIGHLDRTLSDWADLEMLAGTGCFLEFDLFGREFSHYPLADIDMPNDAERLRTIRSLISVGAVEQILLGQDVCKKIHLSHFGGEGFSHILAHVLPLMRRRGYTDTEIEQITVGNPRNAFGWRG